VGDPIIDEGLRLKLEALDAQVVIVDTPLENGGIQGARLKKLEELISRTHGAFWTRQYHNPAAADAYSIVAPTISNAVAKIDILVASVATGGSATGLTRALRRAGHPVRLIAIDTHRSILFGEPDGKRLLRGLGNSIIPGILDYSLVDECHWISAAEAFHMTNHLFRTHLLDIGPTSGATYMVAKWQAEQYPDKNVVFVCADSGERYRCTVYNPQWLASHNVLTQRIPQHPQLMALPGETTDTWSYMHWAGSSLKDVVTAVMLRRRFPEI
jgi:cysteine synthase A